MCKRERKAVLSVLEREKRREKSALCIKRLCVDEIRDQMDGKCRGSEQKRGG